MFAVCGLGDSISPDFCEGGRIWSRLPTKLGATRVVERYEIDGDPDEVDVEGARKWVLKGAEKFTALAEKRG
jgi:flavodoxin